ncbi:MAG: NAD(P)-dependent oxidoreductase [Minisyncoccia bacterium]
MQKIFITGGLGYLGSQLAKEALKKDFDVCLYDSLIYEQDYKKILKEIGEEKKVKTKLSYVIGDTRNIELLKKSIVDFKPDFIFHFAELSSVWAANHNPNYTKDLNYESSKKVIDLAEKLKVPIIYNSTSSLYGNQKEMKLLDEKAPLPEPTDNYCKYKLEMEKYIKTKVKKNPKFKIIMLRPATVCGVAPRMRIELLPNHFTYCAVAQGLIRISELNAYRAAIDVRDMTSGYFSIMSKDRWPKLIYNIGSHNLSKEQFGEAIQKVVKCKIGQMGDLGDLRNLQITSKAFEKDFNWKPKYSLENTIKTIEKWLSENLVEIEKNNFVGILNMSLDLWKKLTRQEPGPLETK